MFAVDLHFNPAFATVESINYEPSIADFWVFAPTYDNVSGTISAAGGTTKYDGFTGNGTLFTVTFKTHRSGVTAIGLTRATALENDGEGTAAELDAWTDTVHHKQYLYIQSPFQPPTHRSHSHQICGTLITTEYSRFLTVAF